MGSTTPPSSTSKMASRMSSSGTTGLASGSSRRRSALGLARKELKAAAEELSANQAGLIVVGEPTMEKAFDKAVTRAAKTFKQTVDAT